MPYKDYIDDLISFTNNAPSYLHTFRGKHIMMSHSHVILLYARLMHLLQLQPYQNQDVYYGSMAPYLHFIPTFRIITTNR